jgi:plastocyanin
MRKLVLSLTAASLIAGFAVAGASAAPGHAAAAKRISVRDDHYTPNSVRLRRGAAVLWAWQGRHSHTVSDRRGRFSSKTQKRGSYTHTFARAGTYSLYCKVHPQTMRMKVIVR